MSALLEPGAELEHLSSSASWGEGPLWMADTARLRWSDIPGDRILEWDSATGETSVYASDVEFVNGRTLDGDGRVVQCSHGRRRMERDDAGVVTGLVDHWTTADGTRARFNSPNDVVVSRDGTIWFTDPPYGIHASGREGHPGVSEYDACFVFRFRDGGVAEPVVTDMVHPNGLAFSPDESLLYVADTGYLQVSGAPGGIRVYDVVDGECRNGRHFADVRPGATDGFRVDVEGRIWSSSADSVQVYSPDAERLAVIPVPEKVANVCFGGPDGRDLYITATTGLYRIRTTTRDAAARG